MTDYDEIAAHRWSLLKSLAVSPLQYIYDAQHPRQDTTALLIGRALHCAILEPDRLNTAFAVWAEGARRGKAWEAFEAQAADRGAEVLTRNEWDRVRGMAAALRDDQVAGPLLVGGASEQAMQWTINRDSRELHCKCRVDLVNGALVDLKTSRDVSPRRFAADVVRYGYHGQIAWYLDGCTANGITFDEYPALVAVASKPPHDVVVYRCGPEVTEPGRRMYERLLDRLLECETRGTWPGVANGGEIHLQLPAWAEDDPVTLDGEEL